MKLVRETWNSIQEKFTVESKREIPKDSKDWKKFVQDLREDIIDFKEHVNKSINKLNNWSYDVESSVNKVNPRYQLQGGVVTLTVTADEVGGEVSVAHGLKYTPSYWIILDSTIAGYICRSKASDSTNVYFKAGATGSAEIAVW